MRLCNTFWTIGAVCMTPVTQNSLDIQFLHQILHDSNVGRACAGNNQLQLAKCIGCHGIVCPRRMEEIRRG